MELRLQELERQLQLAQVARERVVRRTQQDAAAMTEVADNVQRRRHDLASRSERREQALAIAEERRFQRARIEEQQDLAKRESSRWRLDMEVRKEQLSDEQADQDRRDYEVRSRQLQEDDADRDAQGERSLRQALGSVETARRLDDERELLLATAHPNIELGPPGDSPRRRQAWASRPQEVAGVATSNMHLHAVQGTRPAPGVVGTGLAAVGGSSPQTGVLREQQLEELIRKREAELEALWQDFDKEAQEPSGDEHAVFVGPATGDHRTQRTGASLGRPARSREQASPGGGPLAGAWGDTSGDSSSGTEAFRRLAPGGSNGRSSQPQQARGDGHDRWDRPKATGVFDTSESEVS